jgi:hypothetical protein
MFGMWVPEFNLKRSIDDKTPPLQRRNKPTVRLIREVGRLYTNGSSGGGNAIPSNELRFKHCNLWKPESESNHKLVVLFRGDWPHMDEAFVKRKTGSWEKMTFTGMSNECNGRERYTFRASMPGRSYANGNDGGGVKIRIQGDDYFIPITGNSGDRHE